MYKKDLNAKHRLRLTLQSVVTSHIQMAKISLILTISALVASLTACNSNSVPESTTSPQASINSPSPDVNSSPPLQAATQSNVAIPGVQSAAEISFKQPSKNSPVGFFDAVNGDVTLKNNISKSKPIQVAGWAVSPDYSKPADFVILTSGEENTPVKVVPVNVGRPDVAKGFKKPSIEKSGWLAAVEPSLLSGEKIILKAWAFNPTTKEAIQLNKIHEITWK